MNCLDNATRAKVVNCLDRRLFRSRYSSDELSFQDYRNASWLPIWEPLALPTMTAMSAT